MKKRRQILLAIVLVSVGLAAWAQTADLDKIDTDLKKRSDDVKQISDRIDAGDVPDATLEDDLQTLLGYQDEIQNDAEVLKDAAAEPSKRLDELGPPPAEGEPAESAEIAKLRKSLEAEVTRLTGLSKEADLGAAAVDRLIGRVRSLQGLHFLASITKRSISPFSSKLWTEAAAGLAPALHSLTDHLSSWHQDQQARGRVSTDLALLIAALVAVLALLMAPYLPSWHRLAARLDASSSPSLLDKRRRAARRSLSRALLVACAGAVTYGAAVEVGLVGQAGRTFALRLCFGGAVLALAWNYIRAVFSPGHPEWRLVQLDSKAARLLQSLSCAIFGLFIVARILYAGFALADAGIELTLAQATLGNSLFAVLLWFSLSPRQWHSHNAPASSPAVSPGKEPTIWSHELLRISGRLLAVLLLVATGLAFIRWADFIFNRVVLAAIFLILVWSVRVLAQWGLSRLPIARSAGKDTTQTDEDSGKESLGFWLNLALDITLLALSIPGFLLIVGNGWLDLRRSLGLLRADIQIGAISVSFTTILTGVLVFLLVSVGTRWMTTVVDKRLLQRTPLDAGERNSVMTLVNYSGVAAAILIALPIVGVGFSKLAVVAGALSVGVGFGLQSIVSNFVSGLILLFERPIKVGDWVVVPSGEGYVKNIGARATEIQTFDRASILVPNSELVTSAVQNWFYKSRLGRVRVDVGVSYGSDPEQVRDILLDCAKQHASISSFPAASVRWTDFGDSSLNFQLRAYIRNIDDSYTVRSDLRFAIFKAFKNAGVEIPFPQRDLHVRADGTPVGGSTTGGHDEAAGGSGRPQQE